MHDLNGNFFKEIKEDIKIYFYLISINQICRIYFIYSLKEHIGPLHSFDILFTMVKGLKYDLLISSIFCILLNFLMLLHNVLNLKSINLKHLRYSFTFIFTVLTFTINILQIEFFKEFKDNFNETFYQKKKLKSRNRRESYVKILLSILMPDMS